MAAGGDRSPAYSVLQLQAAVGNRAVGRILARQPQVKDRKPTTFHGDGKHARGDVRYATRIGKADAAKLNATVDPLTDAMRADINAKLAWFRGAARDAYVTEIKPALILATQPAIDMPATKIVQPLSPLRRNALERQVNDWYGLIQKLKAERITAWEKNARIPEAKPSIDVMAIVIPIVALGIGGVAYGLIDKMLHDKAMNYLVKEFILLSGLEAADLAAEAAFHKAVKSVKSDFEVSIKRANDAKVVNQSIKGALKKGNDPLSFFVEAMRNHTIAEEAEQHLNFNNSSATMSDEDLQAKHAAMKLVYDQLAAHPEELQRELTVGFIRMTDEARLEERSKRFAGNRDLAFYADKLWSHLRPGEMSVYPAGRPVHSFGKWYSPNLGFEGFEAVTGGINAENFENIKDSPLEKVKVTTKFTFLVKNPYSGGWTSENMDIQFKRDPSGRIIVIDRENQKEWLTSYYTGESRDHTDEERDKYAPLGAEKLYQAVKSKPVKKTRIIELEKSPFDD